jgi:hypothetical protein
MSELTKLLEEQLDILRKSAEPNLATLTRLAVDALVLAREYERIANLPPEPDDGTTDICF